MSKQQEDERLLVRAKVVAIGVILTLMSLLTVSAVIGHPDTGPLIVLFPALSGVLLALFGIRAFINRNGSS